MAAITQAAQAKPTQKLPVLAAVPQAAERAILL